MAACGFWAGGENRQDDELKGIVKKNALFVLNKKIYAVITINRIGDVCHE